MNTYSPRELLTKQYLSDREPWHRQKLSEEDSEQYFDRLLDSGNIITYVRQGELLGYVEVWLLNFNQIGRIICEEPFFVFEEDIVSGNIAYISNMWIHENCRHGVVKDALIEDFFGRFGRCDYMLTQRDKWNRAFKVYPMKHLQGVLYGS